MLKEINQSKVRYFYPGADAQEPMAAFSKCNGYVAFERDWLAPKVIAERSLRGVSLPFFVRRFP